MLCDRRAQHGRLARDDVLWSSMVPKVGFALVKLTSFTSRISAKQSQKKPRLKQLTPREMRLAFSDRDTTTSNAADVPHITMTKSGYG